MTDSIKKPLSFIAGLFLSILCIAFVTQIILYIGILFKKQLSWYDTFLYLSTFGAVMHMGLGLKTYILSSPKIAINGIALPNPLYIKSNEFEIEELNNKTTEENLKPETEAIQDKKNIQEINNNDNEPKNMFIDLHNAIIKDHDFIKAKEIYQKWLTEEEDLNEKIRLEALYNYLLSSNGDTEAFEKLNEMVNKYNLTGNLLGWIRKYIGLCYEDGNLFAKAETEYLLSVNAFENIDDKNSSIYRLALSILKQNDKDRAINITFCLNILFLLLSSSNIFVY